MFSSTHQTSLNYSHRKENPATQLLNHTRVAFRTKESDLADKSIGRGFVRLDSLEGDCFTHKMTQPHHESLMEDMNSKQPPTKSELRWFGNYPSVPNGHRRSFRDNPTTASSFSQSFYSSGFCLDPQPTVQTPYNLTKGQFEYWEMDPTQQGAYFQVFSPTNVGECQAQMAPMQTAVSFVGGIVEMVFGGYSTSNNGLKSSERNIFAKPSSTLNPNAKVFTPQLNPNAKEFTPAKAKCDEKKVHESDPPETSSGPSTAAALPSQPTETTAIPPEETICDEKLSDLDQREVISDSNVCASNLTRAISAGSMPVCVTPEMEEPSLKATSERLGTPWVANSDVMASQVVDETDDETFECDVDDFTSSSEDDDDDDDDEDCDEFALKLGICDESKDCYRRQRSLSSCSDESYIEFTASSPGESPIINSRGVSGEATIGLNDDAADSDDESGESDVDNEDWDEIDQSEANVDLDETMSNLGLVSPLFVPALTNTLAKGVDSSDSSTAAKSSKRFVIENVASKTVDDVYPASLGHSSKDEIERRLRDANDTWSQSYDGYDVCESRSKTASLKRAMFTPQDEWEMIYEDPELAEDLRQARTSDNARRKADHERMERLLGPVLDPAHRTKMWNMIQRCN